MTLDPALSSLPLPPVLERMAETLLRVPGQHRRMVNGLLRAMLADTPDGAMDEALSALYAWDNRQYTDVMEGLAMVGSVVVGAVYAQQLNRAAPDN